ncbi:Membrane-bound lytic murein transglycosylase A precursor [Rhodovastum atsumiense]|uniref:peptidoglycan lytic exotransglycosylase n=1 Tax=Rhodovastum atsumiense TaxID=504468 RepID=A0A5M6IPJ8_9PROT|nr:MltA domain-containing protein [Rhodovastum atsumiense]KAA5609488.1 murein transglycosylase [Rhodovastum atsumiense]CAH2600815.1 Membrane-bound lytic murein transglycosylase A precursor [Rhodovastum atsumiense]
MRQGLRRALARLAVPLAVLGLAACVAPPPPSPEGGAMTLAPVGFDRLPGWQADRTAEAVPAFLAGCSAMRPGGDLGGTGEAAARGGDPLQWRASCEAARALPPGDEAAARRFFEGYFQPWAIAGNGNPNGLFTGYFEPEVAGARSPGGQYRVPLLGRPTDLIQVDLGEFAPDLKGRRLVGRMDGGRLLPYWDRAAIEGGALSRQRLGLLWLTDPVDAFVLQIQGSGRVRLPQGRVVRVSYAAQNGRPYVPIGRVLAERGEMKLDQVSMPAIRAWLDAHPAEAQEVMNQNPSYVFFRELLGVREDEGPPGALGAGLTPGRSIAIDRAYLPLGAPVWLDTTDPLTGAKLQRLTMAQDLGGAIKGPVRADVFWGWGPDAEARAGRMRQPGTQYVLLPKAVQAASR